jgi:hypothetical protein
MLKHENNIAELKNTLLKENLLQSDDPVQIERGKNILKAIEEHQDHIEDLQKNLKSRKDDLNKKYMK